MVHKPGSMYREVKGQPYTRKEYIGGIPHVRVGQFVMGNRTAEFDLEVTLKADEKCQIKDNALESARIVLTRTLVKNLGDNNFKAQILVYPHHVLRENKQATGAGADRLSEGMRRAFGKKVGNAARVSAGQPIISVWLNEENYEVAKDALRKASMKLPTPCTQQVKGN
ncbi:MAG: 50S ribosomal protein L16 [Thermoplasmata archaeon]